MILLRTTAVVTYMALVSLAVAEQRDPSFKLDIELGAAAGLVPQFEGARRYRVSWSPIIKLYFLRVPGIGQIGGGPDQGFSFAPSIRVIGERRQQDDRRLLGLGNIDRAFEFGGKVAYRWQHLRVFAEVRKGFGGHTGWQGALGLDYITRLGSKWVLEAGPRIGLADSRYMSTYFGVNALQSAASGYRVYNAGGGLKTIGLESKLRYSINRKWTLQGTVGYQRLVGDAASSPLVRSGARDAFFGSIGASYRFNLSATK